MKKIYILIYVWRGLIEKPEIFYTKKAALEREKQLKKNMNSDYDEVAVYKKVV